jgi:hypothetical protein
MLLNHVNDYIPDPTIYLSQRNGFHFACVIGYLPDTTIYPSSIVSTLYPSLSTYLIPPYISVTNGFLFVHVIEYLPDTTIFLSPMVSTVHTS